MALDFPNSPTVGQIFTAGSGSWQWDGAKWVSSGSGSGGASITIGDTPPASPGPGALWYDSVSCQLYCYYNDPNSNEWVVANSGFTGSPGAQGVAGVAGPTGPQGVAGVLGGRNFVHNAQFNVQQRGAGPWSTAGGYYTLDRWVLSLTADTTTVSILAAADSDRAGIGDEAPRSLVQVAFAGASSAGAGTGFIHRVEDTRRLGNKTVTVSFYAKASSGTPKIGVSAQQNFGTGGSPSAVVITNMGAAPTLTSSWARYQLTGVIPSTAGKTYGTTANTDFTQFNFVFSDYPNGWGTGVGVQSGTVQLWGMQVEVGSTATPLEKVDYALDLENCQRFYFINNNCYQQGYASAAGNGIGMALHFPVTMRATPTMTSTGTSGGTNYTGVAFYGISPYGVNPSLQSTAAGSVYGTLGFTAAADL